METINRTAFTFECRPMQGVDGAWLAVAIVKGTFSIVPNAACEPHPQQRKLQNDQIYLDELGRSLAWASDLVPFKPYTDFYLHGSFHQPGGVAAPTGRASFQFGPLRKELLFYGPRFAVEDHDRGWVVSPPAPVASVPLRWEHSFGGLADRRNPFGKGLDKLPKSQPPRVALPQIEDPRYLASAPGDRPPPANFAPMSPGFADRQAKLGTRDQRWAVFRAPLPPDDIDPSYHNAAPPGQQAGNYPNGLETVELHNLHPTLPLLRFCLPGLAPRVGVLRGTIEPEAPDRNIAAEEITMHLDTVVALPDEDQLVLTWRGHTSLPGTPPVMDVVWAECDMERVVDPPADFAGLAAAMLERFRAANPPPKKADPEAVARQAAAYAAAGEAAAAQAVGEVRAMLAKAKLPDSLRRVVETENNPEVLLAAMTKHFNETAADLSAKYGLGPPPPV